MNMANPAHPGEVIAEILEDLNVSLRQFAKAMEITPSTASRIISGHGSLSPRMAIKLAAVMGGTPESWLNIQINHSLSQARRLVTVGHLQKLRPQVGSAVAMPTP